MRYCAMGPDMNCGACSACIKRGETARLVTLMVPTKGTLRSMVDAYRGPPGTIVDHLHACLTARAEALGA